MRKAITGTLIVVGVLALVALGRFRGHGAGVEVKVEPARHQTVQSSILASGQLAYREQVQLRSEVIARVKQVLVEEGDRVKKNQVVLRLDPEAFQAEVEQQTANVRMQQIAIERQKLQIDNLQTQWHRKKQLHEKGLLDDNSFDTATNELRIARVELGSRQEALSQARAQLAQAQERLGKTVIKSPMDGIVTGVYVKEGETVISGTTNIAGSTMLSIGDPSEILTKVNVDEADIAKVAVGQSADIHAVAFPDTTLKGKVESIATTARQAEGQQGLSFEVKILLSDTGGVAIRPGMSCRAEIFTARKENTLAVPVAAVRYSEDDSKAASEDATGKPGKGDAYVFLDHQGVAVKTSVDTGVSNDSLQEITSGLKQGDPVIIGPYRTVRQLHDGDAVHPEKPGRSTQAT